jgi:hypothetical protein
LRKAGELALTCIAVFDPPATPAYKHLQLSHATCSGTAVLFSSL